MVALDQGQHASHHQWADMVARLVLVLAATCQEAQALALPLAWGVLVRVALVFHLDS